MSQPFRIESGSDIDRSTPLSFKFNGKRYQGFKGDTLASALLANGVHLIARSFKYHRPRGIYAAGCEDPNAKVQLVASAQGKIDEPNVNATEQELVEGLIAHSQNCWPSVNCDIGAINNLLKRFFPAGFYYKTFMWPAKFWHSIYEPLIRRAAGLGVASLEADDTAYEHCYQYTQILIIGAGYAGLCKALEMAEQNRQVLLIEDKHSVGGKLRLDKDNRQWLDETLAKLQSMPHVNIKTSTQATGYYDQNMVTMVERLSPVQTDNSSQPKQRFSYVRAEQVIIATGAIERPLLFGNNDRPGILLAGSVLEYIQLYGVLPGKKPVVFTNNDSAYKTAIALHNQGLQPIIIDTRQEATGNLVNSAKALNIDIRFGFAIADTKGGKRVTKALIGRLDEQASCYSTALQAIDCDCICVSGHWTATAHLASHAGNKLGFDDKSHSFIPNDSLQGEIVIGDANGDFAEDIQNHQALWCMPLPNGDETTKRFVDLQNDVATSDLALAVQENFTSIEHVKRYTTLGMATDQGKTSNLNGLQFIADILDKPVPEVGHTTFRPPYNPVSIGAIVGGKTGIHYQPLRKTPLHHWHRQHSAVMANIGLWQRPKCYLQTGETISTATNREALNVRKNVAICDVTSLGKIDIQGADSAEFLSRIYINNWLNLPVGKARYGIMIREDGLVLDDGTTTRIGANRFHMTTTTAQAAAVLTHLEYYLQVVWPELDVQVVSTTEQWAGISIAGPNSRQLLQLLLSNDDMSSDGLPFMGYRETMLDDKPIRLFRISFSGELAYEINIESGHGLWLWEQLLKVGSSLDVQPYGTEALQTLRIEMGHVAGSEIDGRHNLVNLSLDGMASSKKDFIGKRSLQKPALCNPEQGRIMGIIPVCKKAMIPEGCYLVKDPKAPTPIAKQGYVTASCWSVEKDHPFALAIVNNGKRRLGEMLYAVSPVDDVTIAVNVVSSHLVDSEGQRVRS